MSRQLTDRELGIQKVNLRTPSDIDAAVTELQRQEHRSKNNAYVALIKEALTMRGIVFDDKNNRLPDEVIGESRVYLSLERSNPAFWDGVKVLVKEVHVDLPDEEGVHCTIVHYNELGNQQTRLVAIEELEPYWYIPRRKAKEEESDFKTATVVPRNLL